MSYIHIGIFSNNPNSSPIAVFYTKKYYDRVTKKVEEHKMKETTDKSTHLHKLKKVKDIERQDRKRNRIYI